LRLQKEMAKGAGGYRVPTEAAGWSGGGGENKKEWEMFVYGPAAKGKSGKKG